ncbi:universal stress protein [Pareuzebyella sediminis]|uniref:universal stress protein n=1 Tax=Pareuzebyella sediminis TaxID=2607998 RepID=UPI0011EC3661|nr:universal stress protein [Pareuzebyella sediminis]
MKNILVAIDFENNEKLLLDYAAEIATKFGSKVWLIHIAEPEPDFVGYEVGPQYIRDTLAEELREEHRQLQDYAMGLTKKEIEADGLLVQGATVEMIMAESEKLNIDLIILGHHEHSFLYKVFLGSVSTEIVKKSKIPVLIVPLIE